MYVLAKLTQQAAKAETVKQPLSQGGAIAMLIIGILCIAVGIGIIFLYIRKKRKDKYEAKQTFKVVQKKYKVFAFWIEYAYIFVGFAAFLAAIILIPISTMALV